MRPIYAWSCVPLGSMNNPMFKKITERYNCRLHGVQLRERRDEQTERQQEVDKETQVHHRRGDTFNTRPIVDLRGAPWSA